MNIYHVSMRARPLGVIVRREDTELIVMADSIHNVRPLVDVEYSHIQRFCVTNVNQRKSSIFRIPGVTAS